MALVGSIALERSLNPAFMQDVRGFVVEHDRGREPLPRGAMRLAAAGDQDLTAKDLDSAKAFRLTADRAILRDYFASRAKFLGFSAAALLKPDGTMIERCDTRQDLRPPGIGVIRPTRRSSPPPSRASRNACCSTASKTFVALRHR